jgi:hypothetical protein
MPWVEPTPAIHQGIIDYPETLWVIEHQGQVCNCYPGWPKYWSQACFEKYYEHKMTTGSVGTMYKLRKNVSTD